MLSHVGVWHKPLVLGLNGSFRYYPDFKHPQLNRV
jgi:hypothetical protein